MKAQTRHSPLPWNGLILDLGLFAWAGVLGFTVPWIRAHMRSVFEILTASISFAWFLLILTGVIVW